MSKRCVCVYVYVCVFLHPLRVCYLRCETCWFMQRCIPLLIRDLTSEPWYCSNTGHSQAGPVTLIRRERQERGRREGGGAREGERDEWRGVEGAVWESGFGQDNNPESHM